MKNSKKKLLTVAAVLVLAALVFWIWWPKPVPVDLAQAQKGVLTVTIDEQGKTRARDRYVVASPVSGRLTRLDWREGDRVRQGQVVAWLHPSPLDPRELAEAQARVQMNRALQRASEEKVREAQAVHEQAKRERDRYQRLFQAGGISRQAYEQSEQAEITGASELESARFRAKAAAYEVELSRARLLAAERSQGKTGGLIAVSSPVSGRILKIQEKSERVVSAGTPLVVVGDPTRLEVVVDLLSSEAVKVRPGMPVILENWGGEQPLRARVRLIEDQGFTKVSALGIEEQRVNVVVDFMDPPGPLGDDYRVEARIVIWKAQNVLKVPAGALFRSGKDWALFAVPQGPGGKADCESGAPQPPGSRARTGPKRR